jgi:hypothetical protein
MTIGPINANYVKVTNGMLMIIIHFGAIYYVFEAVSVRLEPKDQIGVIMILAPLTATFVTLFLKDLVKGETAAGNASLTYSARFSAITVFLTVLYGLVIFFIFYNYLKNQDIGADMLKLYVGLITIIGGFVGIVYGELFK